MLGAQARAVRHRSVLPIASDADADGDESNRRAGQPAAAAQRISRQKPFQPYDPVSDPSGPAFVNLTGGTIGMDYRPGCGTPFEGLSNGCGFSRALLRRL